MRTTPTKYSGFVPNFNSVILAGVVTEVPKIIERSIRGEILLHIAHNSKWRAMKRKRACFLRVAVDTEIAEYDKFAHTVISFDREIIKMVRVGALKYGDKVYVAGKMVKLLYKSYLAPLTAVEAVSLAVIPNSPLAELTEEQELEI